MEKTKRRKKNSIRNNWQLYCLLLPPIIFLAIFNYYPMYGALIAFKDYTIGADMLTCPWAGEYGLGNFIRFFSNYNFKECLINTLSISVYSLAVNFPCSILLALCLNYVGRKGFRKTVQMVSYFPYFISTIVLVGMMNALFHARTGALGSFIFQMTGTNILANADAFSSLYVWSGVWQMIGFNSIIYISALTGVDPQLHEAAVVEGATILQRIRHIDLPAVLPTAAILLILNVGSILNVGYEKVLAMQNPNNLRTSEVISTYSYKVALTASIPDFSYATAIGLFQSVIGLILLLIVNKVVKKLSGGGLL